jgi:hypothetical protein
MGQPITVVEKPSSRPGILRFDTNRALTGMGHERYRSLDDIHADRPPDVIARRLFEHGGVDMVHVHSSVVTVHLSPGASGAGLGDVIRGLYTFYRGADGELPAAAPTDDPASPADPGPPAG